MKSETKKHINNCIIEALQKKQQYKKESPNSKSFAFWQGYANALQNLYNDLQYMERKEGRT
jgi:hypothetical protein